jgi:hypothetical protein
MENEHFIKIGELFSVGVSVHGGRRGGVIVANGPEWQARGNGFACDLGESLTTCL